MQITAYSCFKNLKRIKCAAKLVLQDKKKLESMEKSMLIVIAIKGCNITTKALLRLNIHARHIL